MKLLALLGLALLSLGAPGAAAPVATGTLLVGNKSENTVSFIDLATGRELGRSPTGPMPHEIAVSPDGRQAAAVAYGGRTIDIFDIASRRRVREIDLSPNDGPHGIAWLPDGRIVATTERSRSVTIVEPRRSRDAVTAVATDQQGTHMVVASPDGRRAYTANIQSGSISIVDLAARRLLRNFRIGGQPEAIALSPDGGTLWVGDNEGARLIAFDTAVLEQHAQNDRPVVNVSFTIARGNEAEVRRQAAEPIAAALRRLSGAGGVQVVVRGDRGWVQVSLDGPQPLERVEQTAWEAVRAASGSLPRGRTEIAVRILAAPPLATIVTGPVPIRVAVSPDGRWAVTSNAGAGTLSVIDTRTRRLARTIAVSGQAEAAQVTILFSADGRRLYAAETGRSQVAEVDVASGRVLRRFAAGRQGDGLAIAPARR